MTVNLVAEFLGINCCVLGITGEPFISKLVGHPDRLAGVGGCILGGSP